MDIDFKNIPQNPGVYLFLDAEGAILYVGRATDLRSRVRSYFSDRILRDRGPRIAEMLDKVAKVDFVETETVLDAYILEANLIKKHEPLYNVVDRDNKSFQFVCITDEKFPRVAIVRGREIELGSAPNCKHVFGPFPRGKLLREALKVIRKVLPYRDRCTPASSSKEPRPCFNAQLGLCPGVCDGTVSAEEYEKRVRELRMVFEGKRKQLVSDLEREMRQLAREQQFEEADSIKRRIFALTHIRDVTLVSHDAHTVVGETTARIEAYDVAHTAGKEAVGVMVVFTDGERDPASYRTFSIREAKPGDDTASLREIIRRRFSHSEWMYPTLIVVDGGKAHIRAAESELKALGVEVPVVSVVKTERHMPREILGTSTYRHTHEREIIAANGEAHRFALAKHKDRRTKSLLG